MSQRKQQKKRPHIMLAVAMAASVGLGISASMMWSTQSLSLPAAESGPERGPRRDEAQEKKASDAVHDLVRILSDKVASLERANAATIVNQAAALKTSAPLSLLAPNPIESQLLPSIPTSESAVVNHPLHSILHEPEHSSVAELSRPFISDQQALHSPQEAILPAARVPYGKEPPVWVEAKSFLKPLWGFKHKYNGDAVFGLMFGYGMIDYKRFVGSLRDTGYTDDIVLATSHPTKGKAMRPGVEAYLKKHQVLAYPFQFQCRKKGQKRRNLLVTPAGCVMTDWYEDGDKRGPRPLALIRYEHYQTWVKLYSERSWFLILDTRDTIFQQNPFLPRLLDRSTHDLHLFQENRKVKWVGKCPFNSGWLGCWGRDVPKRFSNNSVVCSGSTMGSKHGITLYVNEMLKEMDSQKCHEIRGTESDQGYHNYLYDTGRHAANGLRVKSWEQGTGVVNTIGAMNGFRVPAHMKGPLGTFWKARDASGYIINWDGTRSPVVHQWDRFAKELIKWIDKNVAK